MTPVALPSHLENFCISARSTDKLEVENVQSFVMAVSRMRVYTFVKIDDFRLSVDADLFSQEVVLVV